MMCSGLFDVAFLGFGGALFISTINIQGALVSLVIGVLAALTDWHRIVHQSQLTAGAGVVTHERRRSISAKIDCNEQTRGTSSPIPSQPLFQLGRVALYPAIKGRVVDLNAPLMQHLFEVAVAYPVAAIPPHRPEDHLAAELPPPEPRHPRPNPLALRQQLPGQAGFATVPVCTLAALSPSPDGAPGRGV